MVTNRLCNNTLKPTPENMDLVPYEQQMAQINRLQSPMEICDESEHPKIILHKRNLEEKQRIRSPFLIGSIDEVNKRISHLDRKLQNYTTLAMESHTDDGIDEDTFCSHRKELADKRVRENKELNKFAGVFTIKSTLLPGLSSRVKNISKISMQASYTKMEQKESGIKPLFAEMYQFPGFEKTLQTQLPRDTSAEYILRKVAEASVNIDKKPLYKAEFERLFYSKMSKALLQDLFWYVFLVKYQHKTDVEEQFFSRIACNYVKLMMFAEGNQMSYTIFFKELSSFCTVNTHELCLTDVIVSGYSIRASAINFLLSLMEYAVLMAQGIYAVFCECFPDSFRQYNSAFKDYLCNLTRMWMNGTRAPKNMWEKWNFKQLEPQNIRQTEELTQVASSKSSMTLLDAIRNLGQSTVSPSVLLISQNNTPVTSSLSHSLFTHKKTSFPATNQMSKNNSSEPLLKLPFKPSIVKFNDTNKPTKEKTKSEPDGWLKSMKSASRCKRESHPLPGAGPDYVKCVFDIYGHSPLMSHVLHQHHSDSESKCMQRVVRTEIENSPLPSSKTYRDLIRESFKSLQYREKAYDQMLEAIHLETVRLWSHQWKFVKAHRKRTNSILVRRDRVKKTCDQLILEQMNPKSEMDLITCCSTPDATEWLN